MKNLKTLLVALVMLLCLALPFGALASGDTLPTMTEQQIIDNLPADAFAVTANIWIRPGTSVTAGGVTYTLIPDDPSYGTQAGDAGETYTVRLSVTSDTYALEVNQIAVQRTVPKRQFSSLSTYYPPTYEVPYGTTYAEMTSDVIKEQAINDGADSRWGIPMDAFTYSLRGEGVIPREKTETTLVLAPDYSHSMWNTYELSSDAVLEYPAYVKAIEQVKLTVELPAGFENRAYGESVGNPTVNGLAEGDSITWLYDGKETIPTLPGTYKLSYELSYPMAYDVSDWQLPAEITIGKALLTMDDSDVSLVYTGSAQPLTLAWEGQIDGLPAGPKAIVTYTDASGAVVDAPKNVGTYEAVVSLDPQDPHYDFNGAAIKIDITPYKITPLLNFDGLTYNGEDQFNRLSVYFDTNLQPAAGMVLLGQQEIKNAGSYTLSVECLDPNFELSETELTVFVGPLTVRVSMPQNNCKFDAKDHLEEVKSSISVTGILPADEGYFEMGAPDEMYHAGDYNFTFGFTDETVAGNYTLQANALRYTIEQINASMVLEAETVILGDNSHWAFSGDSTTTITYDHQNARFPEGTGLNLIVGLREFDPAVLTSGSYVKKIVDREFIGDWTYDDISTGIDCQRVNVKYAELDTTLTPSWPAVSGNQWDSDVTFTPAAGLEMTMDGGETWQASFTPAEDTLETSVTYQVRETATGYVSAPATLTYALDREYPVYNNLEVGERPAQKVNAVIGEITDNLGLAKIECPELNWSQELSGISVTNLALPEITENGEYWINIYDGAGRYIGVPIPVDWIDAEAPTAAFNIPGTELTTAETVQIRYSDSYSAGLNQAYQVDPTLVITAPDGTEVYNDSDIWNNQLEVKLNGTYTWKVFDAAGNEKTGSFEINTIDTTKPVLTVDAPATAPTNEAVKLTYAIGDVAADDQGNAAGIASAVTVYMNNEPVDGDQLVTANGDYTFYAVDDAGNTTDEITVTVDCIDTIAPTVTGWEVSSETSAQTATVTITVEDSADANARADVAGVDKVYVTDADGHGYVVTLENGKGTFTAECNSTYIIDGVDHAGNALMGDEYVVNVLDTAAPVISAITPDVNNDVPANAAYNLTFTVTDEKKDDCGHESGVESTLTVYCNGEEIATTTEGALAIEYEVSANGEYTFTAKDTAGNEAAAATYTVTNLDLVAPELTNLKASTTEPTNDSVILTFDVADATSEGAANAGVAKIEVSYNGEDPMDLGEPRFELSLNGTYTFTITDNAGNTATDSITVDNIDIVDPVLGVDGYTTTDPVSGTVTLMFSASDLGADAEENATVETKCGVDYILIKHASFDAPIELAADATAQVVAYNGIYTIEAYDLAGNVTVDTIEVTNIDLAAPTLEISEIIDPADATNDKVVVSFAAADTGVDGDENVTDDANYGIDTITISHPSAEDTVLELNGAHTTEQTYEALYNGEYTITVVDLAGNTVEDKFTIGNIDQVDPTLKIAAEVDPATPQSGEVIISFTADDKGTDEEQNDTDEEFFGIASIVVEHEKFTKELEVTDRAVSVPYNGVYTITVTDKAGNSVTDEIEVSNIDVVVPTFEYVSTTPAEPTSGTVVIAFTAGDEGADPKEGKTGDEFCGIASIVVEHPSFEEAQQLAVDAKEVTVAYNGTYTFTVTDLAGNSVTKTVKVDNIDQVDPTIEINPVVDPATPVSGEVVISFLAGDKGTDKKENATGEANYGIASIVVAHESFEEDLELAVDADKVTVAYNGVYTFTVTDLAGNTVTDTIEVFNIDVVKPTFEHVANVSDEATNDDVTIKFTTDDEGTDPKEGATGEDFFGVDYILVDHESFDEAVKLEADEESLVVNANGIYTFTVVDLAGNSDTFTVLVDNIDVVAPTFEHKKNDPATATNGEVTINFTTADTGADVLETETNPEYVAVDYILVNHASFEEPQKLAADTKTFVVSVNGIYTFTVVDLAGNSKDFTVEVDNIDHTAPVASYAYAPVYMQSSAGVKITLTTTDAGEDKLGLAAHADNYGLAKVQVTFGGKTVDLPLGENDKDVTAEYIATADGLYTFTFTDKGGNVTTLTADMIYIDDIDPVVTARFVGTNLRIALSDTERLAYFEICFRNTDNVLETVDMYYGLTEVPDHVYRAVDPGTYYVVVYDEAGNSAQARILNPDEDDDGVSDAREKELGTDPAVADTDDDGLTDGEEVRAKTDPLDPDSDGDGLNDGLEVSLGSNPNSADSDSDGVNDYVAYQMGMLEGENQLFGAASMLLGNAYNPAGNPVEPGRFANVDEANAMMNNLESTGLASSVETSDFDSVKKDLSKAVKKTNGVVLQFNANEAEGLAVVNNYLMQFARQKNQFVANKGYDIAEMLGSEEFIVLSNADGSTVLVAPWSAAEQKTTGDVMILNLVADRAVKLNGTAGASHLAISASGESIAYNKDGNVIVLNLAKGQSTSSPVVDLVGLTFVDEMPVSVLQNKTAWGMENGEWKEMDFTSMKNVILDQAQRTNDHRKVLLPGVEMTELEINIQVEVIMNRGDITAKTDAMKRSTTMFDLSQVD